MRKILEKGTKQKIPDDITGPHTLLRYQKKHRTGDACSTVLGAALWRYQKNVTSNQLHLPAVV